MSITKEQQLLNLENKIKNTLVCDLKSTSKNIVFGSGNINAPILIIGEAPGKEEDEQGKPFVGKSGKLLREILTDKNLINQVYITNVVKYHPPDNRTPNLNEIDRYSPLLKEQILIINPKIICTLGNVAYRTIFSDFNTLKFDSLKSLTKNHGAKLCINLDGQEILLVPLFHPSYLLRGNYSIEKYKNDWEEIKKIL